MKCINFRERPEKLRMDRAFSNNSMCSLFSHRRCRRKAATQWLMSRVLVNKIILLLLLYFINYTLPSKLVFVSKIRRICIRKLYGKKEIPEILSKKLLKWTLDKLQDEFQIKLREIPKANTVTLLKKLWIFRGISGGILEQKLGERDYQDRTTRN